MNIVSGLLTFPSHEKSRKSYVSDASLKFLLSSLSDIASNPVAWHKISKFTEQSDITSYRLLVRCGMPERLITRLKRWKSTQSSCEEDDSSTKSRGCIKDHQQAADKSLKCSGDRQSSTTNCKKCPSDSESTVSPCKRPISESLEKPLPYNDRRACECSLMLIDKANSDLLTKESQKSIGKPATVGVIHCKEKSTSCIRLESQKESHKLARCVKKHCDVAKKDDPKRDAQLCESKRKCPIPEKKECCPDVPETPDINLGSYEYQTKPDPPPPKYQHWTENLPCYCDRDAVRTKMPVKPSLPSPVMFVPNAGPWKSNIGRAIASLVRQSPIGTPSKSKCSETVTKRVPSRLNASSEKSASRCVVCFKDKCTDLLALPPPASKVKPKVQFFPTLTKSGHCHVKKSEKKRESFSVPDSDCKPNVAALKYRLSKCPHIKEMWNFEVSDHDSRVNDDVQPEKPQDFSALSKHHQQRSAPKQRQEQVYAQIPKDARRKTTVEPTGEWMRQKYQLRLRIFRKTGVFNPCLPRIVELRQPRGEATRSSPFEDGKRSDDTVNEEELSRRSENPCSDYRSTEQPVVETKSYPTKMDKCRVARKPRPKKCPKKNC